MRTIKLTQGFSVIVDDSDYDALAQYKWYAHRVASRIYAARREHNTRRFIYMHRVILNLTDPTQDVDHINNDTLDNTRSNLRIVPRTDHMAKLDTPLQSNNTSGTRGVTRRTYHNNKRGTYYKYIAQIMVDYRGYYLGSFDTIEEAADAYDAAHRYHYPHLY